MSEGSRYPAATRHPLPCLLFLLPLLVAYEAGVLWLGGTQPEAVRNGADTWLRWGLEPLGLHPLYGAPILVAVIFILWSWLRRADRPRDLSGVLTGMAIESASFAGGLWVLSRGMVPLLQRAGIELSVPSKDETLRQVVTFVGAGIYEEVLFRLLLFSGLMLLLQVAHVPALLRALLATLASAVVFAAAHHVGPYGEAFDSYAFTFRFLAGLYFTLLYLFRGFGVAVGSHTCYDLLVGVLVAP